MDENALVEEKDPHFIDGKKRVGSMDYDGAIDSFERALQANPKSGAAHLELGLLYEQRRNDPVSALYHYQRHLQLRKDSSVADVVAQKIAGCKRELAKGVSVAVVNRDMQRDLDRLTTTNSAMRERLAILEAELQRRPRFLTNYVTNWLTVTQYLTRTIEVPAPQAPQPITPTPAPGAQIQTAQPQTPTIPAPRAPVTPARPERYTVRSGDTFAKIARQYGLTAHALSRANPRVTPSRIKPGQVLIIPPK